MGLGTLICYVTRRRLPGLAAQAAASKAATVAPPGHVQHCTACLGEWTHWLQVEQALQAGPEHPAAPDLAPAILARLPAQVAAPHPADSAPEATSRSSWGLGMALIVAVLPALLILPLVRNGPGGLALAPQALDWLTAGGAPEWVAPLLAAVNVPWDSASLASWLPLLLDIATRTAETVVPAILALIALKPLASRLAVA